MEYSIFFGSENLYKYFVSIGILLIILSIYYPLVEKQTLEIQNIELKNDIKLLNFKINKNLKNVGNIKTNIITKGRNKDNNKSLKDAEKINNDNYIAQIESEKKHQEILVRTDYINLYHIIFISSLILGIYLTIYGFIMWSKIKKHDDNILKLENEKLELIVKKMKIENKD